MKADRPVVLQLAVVKEEVKYLIMDSNSKVIVYEFTVTDGSFETIVTAFLSAYCIKTGSSLETLVILTQVKGEQFESIKTKAMIAVTACQQSSTIKLTRREMECSTLLVRVPGIANKEIAEKMNLSERTVKFHVSALLAKFQVDKRASLAARLKSHVPIMDEE
jgi:DNA-binding NarL/FixJ family response regulator